MEKVEYINEITEKGNIVIRIFNGKMEKKDIIESFKHMVDTDMLGSKSIGLITDISKSDIIIDMEELERMISFISESSILSRIKIAVVADSPQKTMLPTLANFKIGDYLMPFTNLEAAKDWIVS